MKKESRVAESTLESLVEQVKAGDKDALEALIQRIQDHVYGLAIRMLWHPADAEDATQEILVKIVTHLGSFRQESTFTTWVYRIASNHLLTTHKRRVERREMTFEQYEQQIDRGLSGVALKSPLEAEQSLLVEEIRIRCMQGMLLCLDRNLRIAYILGEIFEVISDQGGHILNITATAFRKRLSRARTRIRNFMRKKCSLVNPANPCHCAQQLTHAIETGSIDNHKLLFAEHPRHDRNDIGILNRLQEMDELRRVAVLFRSHPDYAAPEDFVEGVKELMNSDKFRLLRG